MINLTINQILLAPGVVTPPTISLYIADYYTRVFTLIEANVVIDASGNVQGTPPVTSVDPTLKYVLRAVNEQCAYQTEQNVFITIYCPSGYMLNGDETVCVMQDTIDPDATPLIPSEASHTAELDYDICGTFINDEGFNLDGTGTVTQISELNAFWTNGGNCDSSGNTSDGPLNRTAIQPVYNGGANQFIGFSVCITNTADKTYYVGVGGLSRFIIRVNGVDVLNMDKDAIDAQYDKTDATTFFWMLYPITLIGGIMNVVEILVVQSVGKPVLGAEIYDNTSAEITAATDYTDLNLVFSTKDVFGEDIPIANNGMGYTCPSGYSLQTCASPYVCYRLLTTSPLYG